MAKKQEQKDIFEVMMEISKQVEQGLQAEQTEVGHTFFLKKTQVSNFELNDAIIVEVNNKKNKTNSYEIYSKGTEELIASVDEQGLVHFAPEFIENLRKINPRFVDEVLNLRDGKFELPKELEKQDIILTKEEREVEKSNYKRLEQLKKVLGTNDISAYSEAEADKEIGNKEKQDNEKEGQKTFEKVTNKQELNPNARVTQSETLSDIIPEIKEKGFVKIGVVYSNKVQNEAGRFSFVGIDKDGNIQKINSLENMEGTTTGQKVLSINSRDGSLVEQEQVAGMVEIKGRSHANGQREYISAKIGQYGIIELDYVRREMSKEKKDAYISAPIETRNQKPTTREVREFMDRTRNPDMDNEIDRAKGIMETQRENGQRNQMRLENIDDNPYNDTYDDQNKGEYADDRTATLGLDDPITLENGDVTTLRKEADKNHMSSEGYIEMYYKMAKENPRTDCRTKYRRCRE